MFLSSYLAGTTPAALSIIMSHPEFFWDRKNRSCPSDMQVCRGQQPFAGVRGGKVGDLPGTEKPFFLFVSFAACGGKRNKEKTGITAEGQLPV